MIFNTLVRKSGGGGTPLQLELIGEEIIELAEYTDAVNSESITTDINISNTNYAWILVTIECDGTPQGNNDWGGISIAIGGRYTSNSAYYSSGISWYRGVKTFDYSDLKSNPLSSGSYGIGILNNILNVAFSRKCHTTACPKIMGGTYTIRAYGIVGV